jgi:hypothetical protein
VPAKRVERRDLHVVPAADREDEAMADVAVGGIRADRDVGRGVVGIGVHRVGTVELEGGGEADVPRVNADDRAHEFLS